MQKNSIEYIVSGIELRKDKMWDTGCGFRVSS
jgi:hypothetical protein